MMQRQPKFLRKQILGMFRSKDRNKTINVETEITFWKVKEKFFFVHSKDYFFSHLN